MYFLTNKKLNILFFDYIGLHLCQLFNFLYNTAVTEPNRSAVLSAITGSTNNSALNKIRSKAKSTKKLTLFAKTPTIRAVVP